MLLIIDIKQLRLAKSGSRANPLPVRDLFLLCAEIAAGSATSAGYAAGAPE
jgi:hypothetical protein